MHIDTADDFMQIVRQLDRHTYLGSMEAYATEEELYLQIDCDVHGRNITNSSIH